VPLSDHEQRLLEQMEQQLLSDDPRFASTMRGPRRQPGGRRRLLTGVVVAVVGLALLVLSVTLAKGGAQIAFGALSFVVMLGGILYGLSGAGGTTRPGPAGAVRPDGSVGQRPGGRGRSARRGTFMQRLEQRWDRRRDERWG
jgi:hypothetical protein